jgi:hypothetical protein
MYTLQASNKPNKKYMVNTPSGKNIYFGAKGYGDYIYYNTTDKKLAKTKKESYIARHSKLENFNNVNTAGFWARWILWNKPTLRGSINDTSKKFKITIKNSSK